MNQYMVKKINMENVRTCAQYWNAVDNATIKYCNGLKEVWEYCGGRLHRGRCGYSGTRGNIEYLAVRVH